MRKQKPILKGFDEILSCYGSRLYIDKDIKPLDQNFCEVKKVANYVFGERFQKIVGGRSDKLFYLCQSDYLKEMFDEIKCGATYVTAHNSVIKSDYVCSSKKYPNEYIPVLIKRSSDILDLSAYDEISSKIANVFKIPTVYNKQFSVIEKGYKKNYLLSVDFIEYPKEFDTLAVYLNHERRTHIFNFESFHLMLQEEMSNKKHAIFLNDEEKAQLEKDFVEQYLFRRYILKDGDLDTENIGILYNPETNKYELSPVFDMEFAFSKFDKQLEEIMVSDLQYILENHKDEIVEFTKKAKSILKNDLFAKKFFKQFQAKKSLIRECRKSLKDNLESFCESFEKVYENFYKQRPSKQDISVIKK